LAAAVAALVSAVGVIVPVSAVGVIARDWAVAAAPV
jgi:hypothetical protein